MKNLSFLAAVFLCSTALFAESTAPGFSWSLFWSGSLEESKTLHNRLDLKLNFLRPGLVLRGQVLDRHPMNFGLDFPWLDDEKWITNFTGSLYHKPTGSRLLFGVIDEWGLPARIRNPWIRSPPYTENHKPVIADLKTAASSTKQDEALLYLSSPFLNIFPNVKLRSFFSAQTQLDAFIPALSGGLDFNFTQKSNPKKSNSLLLETFFTEKTLQPTKVSSWFSDPPHLPERDFRLNAFAAIFTCPSFSVSSDFAVSQTFAWRKDIYVNFGITVTPLLPFGSRNRPMAFSFAADGSGARFVNRDGANLSEGFRSAAKIELKGRYNSLLRLNMELRADSLGIDFNRSSTGFFWRFPAASRNSSYFLRVTRISLSADRNAVNLKKISDSFSGNLGLSINLLKIGIKSPFGLNFSGSIKGLTESEEPSPFPIPDDLWHWDTASAGCELTWSPRFALQTSLQNKPVSFQFRVKTGYTFHEKKDEKWDFSVSTAIRFRSGRFSIKAATADFPNDWNWTISWRLENRK